MGDEGVQCLAGVDGDLEGVAGLGVEHGDCDLIVRLVPQRSDLDAVAVAAVELPDHRGNGGALRPGVEERIGGGGLEVCG
jgi:hypothetical protein